MASIDHRTRRRTDLRELPVDEVLDEQLPRLLSVNGPLAGEGAAALGNDSLTVTAGSRQFALISDAGSLRLGLVNEAHGAGVAVSMGEDVLSDVMQDVSTLGWAEMMGRLTIDRGTSDALALWDPVVRALRDGDAVFEAGTLDYRDRHGGPLDLHQGFSLDADPADAGHFLAEAGYLHVRNVFSDQEMDAVSAELDEAVRSADRDDNASWWARTDDGWYPARILGFNRKSSTLRELLRSDRFHTLTGFVEDELVQGDVEHTDMAEGLLKKIGVLEGISDVSWHKDCGPGNHTLTCSGLTVGLQITGADRRTGELGVMAGSNRANIPGLRPVVDFGLPRVALPTAKGDCTIHCSCTMHMSRPPETSERRVVYTGFSLAPFPDDAASLPTERERRQNRAALKDLVGTGDSTRGELDRLPLAD